MPLSSKEGVPAYEINTSNIAVARNVAVWEQERQECLLKYFLHYQKPFCLLLIFCLFIAMWSNLLIRYFPFFYKIFIDIYIYIYIL